MTEQPFNVKYFILPFLDKASATFSVNPFIVGIPNGTDAPAPKNINSQLRGKGKLKLFKHDFVCRIIKKLPEITSLPYITYY